MKNFLGGLWTYEMEEDWKQDVLNGNFVQLLSHVWLFATPWIAAHQAPLSLTISQSLFKFMAIESVMPFNHLILCAPFSFCLQSFPVSGSFPVSHLFASDGWNIGALASASVVPVNIQHWFPLRLTGLISVESKGLSRVFFSTNCSIVFQAEDEDSWHQCSGDVMR